MFTFLIITTTLHKIIATKPLPPVAMLIFLDRNALGQSTDFGWWYIPQTDGAGQHCSGGEGEDAQHQHSALFLKFLVCLGSLLQNILWMVVLKN